MKTKNLITILISSALAVSSVYAQEETPGPGRGKGGAAKGGSRAGGVMKFMPVLAALDSDQDGKISSEELENATVSLKTLDKNGDGELTEDEVRPNFGGGAGEKGTKGGSPKGGGSENTKGKSDTGGMKGKGKGGKGGSSDESKGGTVIPKRPPVESE